jgi:type I pantothenate kinase
MENRRQVPLSPFRKFSVQQWGRLKDNTPVPLTESELRELRGINERASIIEVQDVYLPLSRLLSYYVESVQTLNRQTARFLHDDTPKVPFIIGVAGSVAVGKSTSSRILQTLLARWSGHPRVDLITTDGFLHPTAELERRDLMHRKGFPESYDRRALLNFISDIKSGKRNVRAPVYSHLHYNIVPGEYSVVDQPDVLIVEGLNVLQTGAAAADEPQIFVSDFFDFSIYVDAEESVIQKWYVDRFLELRKRVFNQPGAYFSHFANLSEDEAIETASGIWKSINRVNLYENILPTKQRADLILHKDATHAIDGVQLRKL